MGLNGVAKWMLDRGERALADVLDIRREWIMGDALGAKYPSGGKRIGGERMLPLLTNLAPRVMPGVNRGLAHVIQARTDPFSDIRHLVRGATNRMGDSVRDVLRRPEGMLNGSKKSPTTG